MLPLSTQPLWLFGLVLLVPTTLIAMAGPVKVRPDALAAVLDDFGDASR